MRRDPLEGEPAIVDGEHADELPLPQLLQLRQLWPESLRIVVVNNEASKLVSEATHLGNLAMFDSTNHFRLPNSATPKRCTR